MSVTPKKPGPRLIRTPDGNAKIVPFSHHISMSDEDIEEMQKNALVELEAIREAILNGEALGFAHVLVRYDNGDPYFSYGWTDGAMFEGMATTCALNQLSRRFLEEWSNPITIPVEEE
jgi:hypothetical protein